MTLEKSMRASGLPWIEARMLAERALGISAARVAARLRDPLEKADQEAVEALFAQRRQGIPVAYLVEEREFYGRPFRVSPAVLIPRPETELLCEVLLARLPDGPDALNILDLGTGSGIIAITLACQCPRAHITAVDLSSDALAVAQANAAAAGVSDRIRFLQGDWLHAVGDVRFDLIASNPPYIAAGDPHLAQGDLRFEPQQALVGGVDGLQAIISVSNQASRHLSPGGRLCFEHGFDQGNAVRSLLARQGFREILTFRDDAGHERVTQGTFGGP